MNVVTLAKHIGDLDDLVNLLLASTRPGKPWSNRLRAELQGVQLKLQALRVQLSLGKPDADLRISVHEIQGALRFAQSSISKSTADGTTKAAVQLAVGLATSIRGSFDADAAARPACY